MPATSCQDLSTALYSKHGGGALAGRDCRNALHGLMKTRAKQGVSFWDCLGDRLKVPDARAVAYLPDLVK